MPSTVRIQVLPSPIICSGDVNGWEPFEVSGRDHIAVYRPVASGGPSRSIHPSIDYDHTIRQIPSDGGKVTTHFVDRMIPTGTDGTHLNATGWISRNADPSTLEYFPCETITYEVREPADPLEIQRRFLLNLRRATHQVWIGRSAPYIDPPMSLSLKLNDERKTTEEAIYQMTVTQVTKSTLVCSQDIWREAWHASVNPPIDHTIDIVHEAHHSMLSSPEKKYFYAGVAIEQIKYKLWDSLVSKKMCSPSQRRNAINDTKKPHRFFAEELEKLGACSLLKQERHTYETIKKFGLPGVSSRMGKWTSLKKRFPAMKPKNCRARVSPLCTVSPIL